ncbi:histidine kinase [Microbacterium panaciterrae]|uniref:histidine kinase n=1 Tax=Microbacterium panaciterrae TaxID=985759 RepID=A0ABP8P333_9MICO
MRPGAGRIYCEHVRRRSWAFDIAIAVVVAGSGLAEAVWGINATHRQGPVPAEAAVYVITGLLLVIRRIAPLTCMTAIVVVSVVEFALFGAPEGMGVALPGAIGAYSTGRYVDRGRSWWGLVQIAALWLAWDLFDPVVTTPLIRLQQLGWASPWLVSWLVGALVCSQALHAVQRRSARAEREARSVVEERNRIARELHDVIGHSVSVMTVTASAVRRRLTPEQAEERRALETVEAVGRDALRDMRRMVGMLRQDDEEADREPTPGLAQVDPLIRKFREAGLPVEYRVSGLDGALPAGLDLTAYRVIQEGLTNALRHAVDPRRILVDVSAGDGLVIRIRDDGREDVRRDAEPGHGLLGMRERAALYGGTLRAGPVRDGGFELVARFPGPFTGEPRDPADPRDPEELR